MSYCKWKIEKASANNAGGWNSPTEVTSYQTPVINVGLGDIKDSFQFNVKNFNDNYDSQFMTNDKITLYRVFNTETVTSDNIIMVGTINDVPSSKDTSKNSLRISGYNYSEAVAGAIVFVDFRGLNLTIPYAIKKALETVKEFNDNFEVKWSDSNKMVKTDGTAFPIIYEKYFNQPLKKILEDLSTNAKTEDTVDYFWYVNNNNELIWKAKEIATSTIFDSDTTAYKSLKDGKDKQEVRNFFILKAGRTPNGEPIQWKSVDWSSIGKNGMRYQFVATDNIQVSKLISQDIKKSFGDVPSTDGYPNLSSAFTTAWVSGYDYVTKNYSISVTAGNPVTINEGSETANKKAYCELLKTEMREVLREKGKKLQEALGKGKLQVDIKFRAGQINWGLGTLVSCTISEIGLTSKTLRVKEIQYTTEYDTFSLEEDIGSI